MLAQFQYTATSSGKGTLWEGLGRKCYGVRPFMRSKTLTRAPHSPYNFVSEFKCESELMSYVYRGSSGNTEDELGFHQTKKILAHKKMHRRERACQFGEYALKQVWGKLLSSLLRSGKGVNIKNVDPNIRWKSWNKRVRRMRWPYWIP